MVQFYRTNPKETNMKKLMLFSATLFLTVATAQACEPQKRFLLKQLKNPASAIGLELKGKDVLEVKKVERADALCDFAVKSEWTTEDGDLAECYTQVRVVRGRTVPHVIKFLNPTEHTLCFL
jgi:hypothetical protein